MEKAWLDENCWNIDSSSTAEEIKANQLQPCTHNLTYPLSDGLKDYINRELYRFECRNPETLSLIEETIKNESPTLKDSLLKNLKSKMGDNTQQFVNRIIVYKTKPCREGPACKRGGKCIFTHNNENRNIIQNDGYMHNDRKRRMNDENVKREKKVEMEYNECIFNRVPENLQNIAELKQYAEQFGNVREVKELKEGKYLIKYTNHEEAKALIASKDLVLGDENIKKFYNKFAKRTSEEDLVDLLNQQEELIKNLYGVTSNKDIVNKLAWVSNRIKSVIVPKEEGRKKRDDGYKKDSFFCNSKFTMD